MTIKDIKPVEFDTYYGRYIDKLSGDIELIQSFITGKENVVNFFKAIDKEKMDYRYAENKWSIKEVFQHLIDTERIFIYRCFRIARHDTAKLTGFDQNSFINPSKATTKSIDELVAEFQIGRDNSIAILKSLKNEDLCQIGSADGKPMSARAAAFTIAGHDIWHMDVISERYLEKKLV